VNEVYIPLKPESKEPDVKSGWQSIDYKGVPISEDARLGLRLDRYIVVDCDDEAAKEAWLKHIDKPMDHTWVRKTPHGYHFFYRRTFDVLDVTPQKLLAIAPKLELKAGIGHYVVYVADGYKTLPSTRESTAHFQHSWVPERQETWVGEEWSEMPDGIGDNAMLSFAGTFRRWGMDEGRIRHCLNEINRIVMTRNPMPAKSIRRLARQAAKYNPEESRSVLCPSCGNEVETR
jgi:hypothetical protein